MSVRTDCYICSDIGTGSIIINFISLFIDDTNGTHFPAAEDVASDGNI